jgi:hypothetical protein
MNKFEEGHVEVAFAQTFPNKQTLLKQLHQSTTNAQTAPLVNK